MTKEEIAERLDGVKIINDISLTEKPIVKDKKVAESPAVSVVQAAPETAGVDEVSAADPITPDVVIPSVPRPSISDKINIDLPEKGTAQIDILNPDSNLINTDFLSSVLPSRKTQETTYKTIEDIRKASNDFLKSTGDLYEEKIKQPTEVLLDIVNRCMKLLTEIVERGLTKSSFDEYEEIKNLWNGVKSVYDEEDKPKDVHIYNDLEDDPELSSGIYPFENQTGGINKAA